MSDYLAVKVHMEIWVRRDIPRATVTPAEIVEAVTATRDGIRLELREGSILKDTKMEIGST